MTAEVAFCHQCVSYNKEAGEEEVVRKLCPCSVAGIFQESTASSLAFGILDNIVEIIHRKDQLFVKVTSRLSLKNYITRCDIRK